MCKTARSCREARLESVEQLLAILPWLGVVTEV
jgi:hypothetical protein